MGFLKAVRLIMGRKRMTKEEKIIELKNKMEYIKSNILPLAKSPAERRKAEKKITAKYERLMRKVQKGK